MSAKTITDQLIAELLGTHPESVLRALARLEDAGRVQEDTTGLGSFRSVTSWETLYGSTAGPFPGVGGAAMTWFRMTALHSETAMLLFANDQFYGAAPYDAAALTGKNVEAFELFHRRPRA
ncbi:MAG TPA: hypothetical protein VF885_12895 [Arthrobacter sp.]